MKKLTTLTLTIVTTALLASCGTESPNQNKQGKRIGTWMAYKAQSKAYWTGTGKRAAPMVISTIASDDTTNPDANKIILNNPVGISVRMIYHADQNATQFGVIDSTTGAKTESNIFRVSVGKKLRIGGGTSWNKGSDYKRVQFGQIGWIKCTGDIPDYENIKLYSVHYDQVNEIAGDTVKTTILNTSGLYRAARYLKGC